MELLVGLVSILILCNTLLVCALLDRRIINRHIDGVKNKTLQCVNKEKTSNK